MLAIKIEGNYRLTYDDYIKGHTHIWFDSYWKAILFRLLHGWLGVEFETKQDIEDINEWERQRSLEAPEQWIGRY